MASGSTWLPVNTLMLKVSFFLCSQALRHPSSPWPLRRTVGDSVQLQLNTSLSSNIRDIEWVWVPEYSKLPVSVVSVVWRPPSLDANWYRLEEKYRQRLNLTKTASLSIRNLTVDMSGLYTARIKFHTGENQEEAFRLSVYEPTPQPRILIHSSYLSSDWCNVSLECGVPGPRKHLTVAWESKGLSRELEQQGGSSLSLSLPLIQSQSKVSLTCVLSSPVGQKKDTLHLGSICAQNGLHGEGQTCALS
ncbi:CD48 antigen-like isoform X2 [Erinaceus europaeus]|uniref:CD48 antigen-like isoform X2 n=1 Tax=Erinaceus europaeus TaxID=9365 RepID=A0ABM3Y996_ERIEU|nr:CD48 antigen-like isoform X2 [Erinaceus europaeus]